MAEGAKPNSSLERPLWYSPESSRSIKTFGAGLVCAIGAIVALGALAALLPNADKIPLINHFAQIPSDIFYPGLTLVLFITAASGWYCKKSFSSEVKPSDSAPPTQETTETSTTPSSTKRAATSSQPTKKKLVDEKEELLKEEEFKNLFGEGYFNTLYQAIDERLKNRYYLQKTVSLPQVEKKVVILASKKGNQLTLEYFWGGSRESTEPHSNTRLENRLEFLKEFKYKVRNEELDEEEFKKHFGEEYHRVLYQDIKERLQDKYYLTKTAAAAQVGKEVVIVAFQNGRDRDPTLYYFWGNECEAGTEKPLHNEALDLQLFMLNEMGYKNEKDLLAGETIDGADHELVKQRLTQSGYDTCVKPSSPVEPGQYRIGTADNGHFFILYLNAETRFFRTEERFKEAIENSGCYDVLEVEDYCKDRQRIKESQQHPLDTKPVCEDPTMAYKDSEYESNKIKLVIFYYRKNDEIIWDYCKQEDLTAVLQSKNLTPVFHTL